MHIEVLEPISMTKKNKKPWPTKDVMNQIYELKLWGGKDFDFYSGSGSHNSKITIPYINALLSFLKAHNPPLTVCDLGCGDFNIGKELVKYSKKYYAIDIVKKLIDRNKSLYKSDKLEFSCLDIVSDNLPFADCVIIRQVLQHLSNAEILSVVKKLSAFKYIILTEHIPFGNFTSNKDIISGQGIRLKQNSGVNILDAPFNLKIKGQKLLDEYILENGKGRIITTFYEVF